MLVARLKQEATATLLMTTIDLGAPALGGVVACSAIAAVPGGGRQRHDGPGEDGGNSYVQKLYLLVASQINVIAN